MATFLEDSLSSPLDYDSEVAYITMTSPVCEKEEKHEQDDEFDFSLTTAGQSDENNQKKSDDEETSPSQENNPPLPERKNPPRLSRLSIPGRAEVEKPEKSEKRSIHQLEEESSPMGGNTSADRKHSLSPLSLDGVPHFTLDTEGPRTPTSQLRRIKVAKEKASSHSPSTKSPKAKLQTTQHMYCTLVVYGSSGCGRTHLVNKLAQSNPTIFAKVINTTTRKRRTHEVSGVDFHFISHKEMSRHIAQGDFIEHITISRKRRETAGPLQRHVLVQNHSMGILDGQEPRRSRTVSTAASEPKLRPADGPAVMKPLEKLVLGSGRQYDSAFELREEDSPVAGGEVFGTSHQSLSEAIQQGKPCILLNVSSRSAQLLASSGLEGSYVLIQNGSASKDKPPRVGGGLQPQHIISAASLDQAYSSLNDYAFQLVSNLNLPLTSNYQAAQYEWDSLPTVSFDQTDSTLMLKQPDVTFSELLAHFQGSSMKKHIQKARSEFTKPKMFTRAKLSKKLLEERLLMQATSYCSISNKESLHLRTLQTVYSKLTGNVLQCRRFSPHWLEIGFSGVDPADDLQEVGLLGPAQLIYFLDNPGTAQICKEIFQFCHMKESKATPFCALSFSFTKFSLDVLEDGLLNKVCNKQEQVFAVVNDFYMASFHHYYVTWRASRKSLLELGLLQHTCQDYCRSHALQVLKEFSELVNPRVPQVKGLSEVPKTELLFTHMTMNDTTTSTSEQQQLTLQNNNN